MAQATTHPGAALLAFLGLGLLSCLSGGDRLYGGDAPAPQQPSVPPEQALIVTVKLSDGSFGNPTERAALFALEDELEQAVVRAGVGEFDGNEFGGGVCVFYMYGPDADKLEAAVAPSLRSSAAARGAHALKRYGGASDPAVRTAAVEY